MKKILTTPIIRILLSLGLCFLVLILASFVKGGINSPFYYQTHQDTNVEGPFEVSNSTSRYALTESIVKNHTFFLDQQLAKFSAPDVAYYHNQFISLFTPGVSFVGIPFYLIGNMMGLPQLITFLLNPFVAILNIFLIAFILKKINISFVTGIFSGLVFVLATNALAYSFTLTQHDLSVCLILLGILNLFEKRTWLNNFSLGILFGAGALVDIPNILFFIPILLCAIYQHIAFTTSETKRITVSLKISVLGLLLGIIPLLALFAWYNMVTDGSYTKLAQFIGRTHFFTVSTQNLSTPSAPIVKVPIGTLAPIGLHLPFESRLQLEGLYTLLISDERSWIYYSPIVFFGLIGLYVLYKNEQTRGFTLLITSIIEINILIYSMFGDPWGGWAFGPRYLIPSAALLCLGIGPFIDKYKKNALLIPLFFAILIYSIWVNSMGALTTTAIPPKVEAQNLLTHIPYTYKYNEEWIAQNKISSLVYNFYFAKKVSGQTFLWMLVGSSFGAFILLYLTLLLEKKEPNKK